MHQSLRKLLIKSRGIVSILPIFEKNQKIYLDQVSNVETLKKFCFAGVRRQNGTFFKPTEKIKNIKKNGLA